MYYEIRFKMSRFSNQLIKIHILTFKDGSSLEFLHSSNSTGVLKFYSQFGMFNRLSGDILEMYTRFKKSLVEKSLYV
jgi:hypothetical protein